MAPIKIDGTDITGATIDGTDVQEITVDGDTVFTAGPPPGAFDLDKYSHKVADGELSTQGTFPTGAAISTDGTSLTVVDLLTDKAEHYILSTPFELSTASFDSDITTTTNAPGCVTFNDDGTKMYVGGFSDNELTQSSLSTPFDPTTATFGNSNNFGARVLGVAFNPTGTKVFIARGAGTNDFVQHSLSTPFDITNTTFQKSEPFPQSGSRNREIQFSNDGSVAFGVDGSSNPERILEFSINSPFDIGGLSTSDTLKEEGGNPRGMVFSENGDRFYEVDADAAKLFEFTL